VNIEELGDIQNNAEIQNKLTLHKKYVRHLKSTMSPYIQNADPLLVKYMTTPFEDKDVICKQKESGENGQTPLQTRCNHYSKLISRER
jgi:hypothetical protein